MLHLMADDPDGVVQVLDIDGVEPVRPGIEYADGAQHTNPRLLRMMALA